MKDSDQPLPRIWAICFHAPRYTLCIFKRPNNDKNSSPICILWWNHPTTVHCFFGATSLIFTAWLLDAWNDETGVHWSIYASNNLINAYLYRSLFQLSEKHQWLGSMHAQYSFLPLFSDAQMSKFSWNITEWNNYSNEQYKYEYTTK